MKKKLSWPFVAVAVHFLLCLLLSFPWSFLEGMYLGLLATFFILWGLSLPVLSACIGLISSLCAFKRNVQAWDVVTVAVSGVILLSYIASAIGLWKNMPLNFVYIAVFALTVLLWMIAVVRWIGHRKRNRA